MVASQQFAVAVHLLSALASYKKKVSSETLSETVQTHPPLLRQTLAPLIERGWVQATRGKTGGYELHVRPAQISLWDVYLTYASCGEVLKKHQYKKNKKCPVSSRMGEVMDQIEKDAYEALKKSFDSWTLADVLKQVEKS